MRIQRAPDVAAGRNIPTFLGYFCRPGWQGGFLLPFFLLLGAACRLWACDPEPGPHHFFKPELPPPMVEAGFFEVFNSLNGLPCDRIRTLKSWGDSLLVGTDGGGLVVYQKGQWTAYNPSSKPPFPESVVTSLALRQDGASILAGTPSGIVVIRAAPGEGWTFEKLVLSGLPSANVVHIAPWGERCLVALDNGAGLLTANQYQPLAFPGLVGPSGLSAAWGGDLGAWVGGNSGLFRIHETFVDPVKPLDFELGWVQAILSWKDLLWIGGSRGLYLKKEETFRPVLPEVWVTSLALNPGAQCPGGGPIASDTESRPADKTLSPEAKQRRQESQRLEKAIEEMVTWFQNPAHFSSSEWTTKSAKFFQLNQRYLELGTVASQPAGDILKGLWIGTQDQGLIFLNEKSEMKHLTSENSRLPSNHITCIEALESGEMWAGTREGGLFHYSVTLVEANASEPEFVYPGKTTLVRVVKDNLYLGTRDQGLLVYNPRTLFKVAHYQPNSPNGFHRHVSGVDVDERARLWVTGDQGVFCLDRGTWQKYDEKTGLGQPTSDILEIDNESRVYVTCKQPGPVCRQLFQFNGARFISYAFETIKEILSQKPASASQFLKALSMASDYQRSFDVNNASRSLSVYDEVNSNVQVTAMLGTPFYLLMGSESGGLIIFDGEGFKNLSKKGTGSLGKIIGLGLRPNLDIVIVGKNRSVIFDGQHFQGIPPVPMTSMNSLTDFSLDDLNPAMFWVAFTAGSGGGAALYQKPFWKVIPSSSPVTGLAVSDPYLFFGTPEGVFRVRKR